MLQNVTHEKQIALKHHTNKNVPTGEVQPSAVNPSHSRIKVLFHFVAENTLLPCQ